MVKLQQPSTFGPFVRQSRILAIIALRTSYNDVANVVTAASAQWNDMIGLPFVREIYTAVVAFALLSLVLFQFLRECMRTFGVPLTRVPSHTERGVAMSVLPSPVFAAFSALLRVLLSVPLRRCQAPFMSSKHISSFDVLYHFGMRERIRSIFLIDTLFVGLVMRRLSDFKAGFTRGGQSVSAGSTNIELGYRLNLTTYGAEFFRGHSVSLSLSRWFLSASGASARRSGISLADMNIIPQGRS